MTSPKYLLCIIGLLIVLAGCPLDNGNNEPPYTTPTTPKFTAGYLSSLMVDIGDATALGISKKPIPQTGNRKARSVTDVVEIAEKNYLVKITTDISHGNVEWDESGLTNVTFKKKTTVDTTVYIPVCDEEGHPIYLTDENGILLEDEEGHLILKMQVIEEQTVTQDEIPTQVNRLYAYNTYTFIQFVPDDTATLPDIRPNDLDKPDHDGYYAYDKCDYYNDDFHQSFVIENSTGNIYSLADTVHIESIHNGLLKIKDNPYIWDCRIKTNYELELFTLFQNTTIHIRDYYKDKYGNNYIYNNAIDTIVPETNTVFFQDSSFYIMARNTGEVVFIDGVLNVSRIGTSEGASEIRIMGENLSSRPISSDDYLEFDDESFLVNGDSPFLDSHYTNSGSYGSSGSFIKNKEWFFWGNGFILILNTDTAAINHYIMCVTSRNGSGTAGSGVFYSISLDTVLIRDIFELNLSSDKLYYYQFDFNSLPVSNERYAFDIGENRESLILLLENFDKKVGNASGPYTVTTLNGQVEYTVFMQEVNGKRIPVAVKSSEYVAEEQQTITLKPINR